MSAETSCIASVNDDMRRSLAISIHSQLVTHDRHPGVGSSSSAGSEDSLSRSERRYVEWSSEARQQPGSNGRASPAAMSRASSLPVCEGTRETEDPGATSTWPLRPSFMNRLCPAETRLKEGAHAHDSDQTKTRIFMNRLTSSDCPAGLRSRSAQEGRQVVRVAPHLVRRRIHR
jgi:hypothetical protein